MRIRTRVEYSFEDLKELGMIKRKQLFRDILGRKTSMSVQELADLLGIRADPHITDSGRKAYDLLRETLEALVEDGVAAKIDEEQPVTYYLRTTRKEVLTHEEILFRRWEERLKEEHGWFRFDELEQITGSVTTTPVMDHTINLFIEFVNNRNKVWIQRTHHQGVATYFVKGSEASDRYEKLKDRLPGGEWLIDKAVAKGKRPSVTAATVLYVLEDDVTQEEAAHYFETTPLSIRNNQDWVRDQLESEPGPEVDNNSKNTIGETN